MIKYDTYFYSTFLHDDKTKWLSYLFAKNKFKQGYYKLKYLINRNIRDDKIIYNDLQQYYYTCNNRFNINSDEYLNKRATDIIYLLHLLNKQNIKFRKIKRIIDIGGGDGTILNKISLLFGVKKNAIVLNIVQSEFVPMLNCNCIFDIYIMVIKYQKNMQMLI
jgi:hypothetical protein